jgi:hypothetical protein
MGNEVRGLVATLGVGGLVFFVFGVFVFLAPDFATVVLATVDVGSVFFSV